MKIEQNVQRLIDKRKWTIYKLAQESGVPLTVLYSLGNKKQGPRTETLVKIADALGVTLDELVR